MYRLKAKTISVIQLQVVKHRIKHKKQRKMLWNEHIRERTQGKLLNSVYRKLDAIYY